MLTTYLLSSTGVENLRNFISTLMIVFAFLQSAGCVLQTSVWGERRVSVFIMSDLSSLDARLRSYTVS
jgi:hypothetical protein